MIEDSYHAALESQVLLPQTTLMMGSEFDDQGTIQEAKELVGAVIHSAVCLTGAGLSCLEET